MTEKLIEVKDLEISSVKEEKICSCKECKFLHQ